LKRTNKVICVSADDGFTLAVGFHYFLKPFVYGMVQVDVRQNWGNTSALRRSLLWILDTLIFFQDSYLQPFIDQPEKAFVIFLGYSPQEG
jgi:hypothetical protein